MEVGMRKAKGRWSHVLIIVFNKMLLTHTNSILLNSQDKIPACRQEMRHDSNMSKQRKETHLIV